MAFRKASAASGSLPAFAAASPCAKNALAVGVPLLSCAPRGAGDSRYPAADRSTPSADRARFMARLRSVHFLDETDPGTDTVNVMFGYSMLVGSIADRLPPRGLDRVSRSLIVPFLLRRVVERVAFLFLHAASFLALGYGHRHGLRGSHPLTIGTRDGDRVNAPRTAAATLGSQL